MTETTVTSEIIRLGPFKQRITWVTPTAESSGTYVWLIAVTTVRDGIEFGQSTLVGDETLARHDVLESVWIELENELRSSVQVAGAIR